MWILARASQDALVGCGHGRMYIVGFRLARPALADCGAASAGARMGHARCHEATVYLGASVVESCVHGTTLLVALLCGAML